MWGTRGRAWRSECGGAISLGPSAVSISTFFALGQEIITLYEKAKHNKDLCSFLLKRCNCAEAAVRDLNIRKTENEEFFSKEENLILFKGFIGCMKKIKSFIRDVSQLSKLKKYFFASRIDEDFADIVKEFDGYLNYFTFQGVPLIFTCRFVLFHGYTLGGNSRWAGRE